MKMKKIVFVLSLAALFNFAPTIAQETNETTNTTTEAVATTPAEEDIVMAKETINVWETIVDFAKNSGIGKMLNTENEGDWRNFVMLGVACLLLYLAIVKQFEPLLLLPIAFGMLLTNFPGA
ncbi:MAG TPA: sodium ion-translocating decarboxylase subunit beta, partial [Paludibacteraceae bacterium]|nr:sodium ion-translocating decarboxylase subunit beta [Paludibacteraceae bacterium]